MIHVLLLNNKGREFLQSQLQDRKMGKIRVIDLGFMMAQGKGVLVSMIHLEEDKS